MSSEITRWKAAGLLAPSLLLSHRLLMHASVWLAPPSLHSWRVVAVVPLVIAAALVAWIAVARMQAGALAGGALASWVLAPAAGVVAMASPAHLLWVALAPYLLFAVAFAVASAAEVDDAALLRALAALAGLVAVSVVVDAESSGVFTVYRRPGGVLGNRNFAGEYLALALPCLVVCRARGVAALFRLALGVALLWTRCRAAWIAAAAGALALLLTSSDWPRLLRPLASVVAGAALGFVLPSRLRWHEAHPFSDTARRIFELSDGSGAMRLRLHRELWRLGRDRMWTGLGPGAWQRAVGQLESHAGAQLRAAQRLPARVRRRRAAGAGGARRGVRHRHRAGRPAASARGVALADVAGHGALVPGRFAALSSRGRGAAGVSQRSDVVTPRRRSMNARAACSPRARASPSRIQCASSRSTKSSAAPPACQVRASSA